MTGFRKFLSDDVGAVTIDWVALTSGILLVGIMAVYAIYNYGASATVDNANNMLAGISGGTTLETVTIGGSTIHGG